MFGHRAEVPRSLGSPRLGGPHLLKTILPAVLDELHQACMSRRVSPASPACCSGNLFLADVRAYREARMAGTGSDHRVS